MSKTIYINMIDTAKAHTVLNVRLVQVVSLY
jgi:hypothetical protein